MVVLFWWGQGGNQNYRHFAYKTLRPLDSSPMIWTVHLLDMSPTGQFAYTRGHFTYTVDLLNFNMFNHALLTNRVGLCVRQYRNNKHY